MECFPPEILLDIFSRACNDGGRTGRSLSLVSRRIYQVSQSIKFQSIACHNSAQIITFASVLEKTPSQFRNLRHLLVFSYYSDINRMTTAEKIATGMVPPTSAFKAFSKRLLFFTTAYCTNDATEFSHCVARMKILVPAAILRILTLVAPTLRTLSIYSNWCSSIPLLIPSCLLSLTELSIGGLWPHHTLHDDTFSAMGCCPSLRRLLLTGFWNIPEPEKLIDAIGAFAPSVTHLSLPAYLVSPMVSVLRNRMTKVDGLSGDTTFPLMLQVLLLHYTSGLVDLSSWEEDSRVILVERLWGNASSRDGAGQWESGWIDGINGGEGFWTKGRI